MARTTEVRPPKGYELARFVPNDSIALWWLDVSKWASNSKYQIHLRKQFCCDYLSRTSSQINLNFSSLTISSKQSLSERPGGGEGAFTTADFETDSENPEGKNVIELRKEF